MNQPSKSNATWHKAVDAATLAAKGRMVVRLGGKQIALFHRAGAPFACNNRCPHEGYPLAQGTLEKVAAVVYERHFHSPEHRSTAWLDRCLGQARAGLDELTRRLAAPYACGPTLSHADVMITTLIWYMQDRMGGAAQAATGLNWRSLQCAL